MNYFLIYAVASVVLATLYILIRFKKIKGVITGNPFWNTGKMVLFNKISKPTLVVMIIFGVLIFVVICPLLVPFFIINKTIKLFKKKPKNEAIIGRRPPVSETIVGMDEPMNFDLDID